MQEGNHILLTPIKRLDFYNVLYDVLLPVIYVTLFRIDSTRSNAVYHAFINYASSMNQL